MTESSFEEWKEKKLKKEYLNDLYKKRIKEERELYNKRNLYNGKQVRERTKVFLHTAPNGVTYVTEFIKGYHDKDYQEDANIFFEPEPVPIDEYPMPRDLEQQVYDSVYGSSNSSDYSWHDYDYLETEPSKPQGLVSHILQYGVGSLFYGTLSGTLLGGLTGFILANTKDPHLGESVIIYSIFGSAALGLIGGSLYGIKKYKKDRKTIDDIT